MTKDEALKMAIEHIEHNGATTERKMVLQACKEALEQPAQEPVGYISTVPVITPQAIRADKNDTFKIPVYTHPAPVCKCGER